MAQSFSQFIAEEKNNKPYKLIVVSNYATSKSQRYFHTTQRLLDEAEKRGIKAYPLMAEVANVDTVNHKVWNVGKEEFDVDPDNTIAIIRGSVAGRDAYLDLVSQLEKMGVCVVNSRETVLMCADKYRTAIRLSENEVPTPKTALLQSIETLQDSLDRIGENYPLILKTLRGSKGIGVIFIESRRQLDSIIQLLWKQDDDTELLVQTYIKADHDIRVLVLNDKIFASMRRDVVKGDFRSNASLGAKVSEYELNEEEAQICINAHKAVDGIYTAVDLIKSGKDSFVLEVNSSPGTSGIEKATGRNLMGELLDHFMDRDNWRHVPHICGWEEIVTVKPFGKMIAKFDTGNGIYPVIHAEDVKVNGKKITFTNNNKTITTQIVGEYTSLTGGGEDKRYLVELEFEFANRNYGKIKFGLDNRDDFSSDVLLNRKSMVMLNVVVSPQRKYVITTPDDVENN